MIELHLASASPRRAEILTVLGVSFTAAGVDIDETPHQGEQAGDMVLRLAKEKALAAKGQHPGLILGSDTAVALEGLIFGKPTSGSEAIDMLMTLSGRRHEVLTAIALVNGDEVLTDTSVTSVLFRDIRPDEARQYWQSGEPRGKAGAYAIQGCGGAFVESISGSYSGVVGLPVFETARLLEQAGLPVFHPKPDTEPDT